jgi:hypothetical protein
MSGTTKQRAIHQIRLGKPKKNGQSNVVQPNELFDCPNEDLEWLQSQGACVDPDESDVAAAKKKAAATTDPNAAASTDDQDDDQDDDDQDDDQDDDDQDDDDQDDGQDGDGDGDADAVEAERQELLKEAKALKITGVRKDLTAETLREKIAEHKAAKGGEDDDEEEDVL